MLQLKTKTCETLEDIASVVSHNTETIHRHLRKTRKSIRRLTFNNIIFGVAGVIIGLKIREMEDQISGLHRQIEELKDKEG